MTNGVLYGEYEMSVWPALLGVAEGLALILLFVVGLTMTVRLVWQAGRGGSDRNRNRNRDRNIDRNIDRNCDRDREYNRRKGKGGE